MLPSAEKLYGDADFIFQQDLAPAHTVKSTRSWFNDHGVTVLDWPANLPDLNYCQEEDERHQTQQCRWHEGRYQRNLGFHYTWAVPQADWLHATPHWCSNSCKRRPNEVLSAYKLTYFSEAWHFCLKYLFFYWSYVIFKFSDTLNLGFSWSVTIIIKISRNNSLNISLYVQWIFIIYGFHFLKWVTKNIDLFHNIIFFLDVQVFLFVLVTRLIM